MAKLQEVTRGVYMMGGMMLNYFVDTADGLVLIDTGLPGNGRAIMGALSAMGKNPPDLAGLFITHADGDHYGASEELRRTWAVDVYAGSIEAEAMRKGESSRQLQMRGLQGLLFGMVAPMFRSGPSEVDQILTPGETVFGLRVLSTPGHTPGHLSFFLPEQRVLFAGDSIQIRGGRPGPSTGGNTWDLALARRSFEEQMALNPAFLCCGHGYSSL